MDHNFKMAYMAAFLGAYAAKNYERNCQNGWKDISQPVEDAEELACEAWKQWNEHINGVLNSLKEPNER